MHLSTPFVQHRQASGCFSPLGWPCSGRDCPESLGRKFTSLNRTKPLEQVGLNPVLNVLGGWTGELQGTFQPEWLWFSNSISQAASWKHLEQMHTPLHALQSGRRGQDAPRTWLVASKIVWLIEQKRTSTSDWLTAITVKKKYFLVVQVTFSWGMTQSTDEAVPFPWLNGIWPQPSDFKDRFLVVWSQAMTWLHRRCHGINPS